MILARIGPFAFHLECLCLRHAPSSKTAHQRALPRSHLRVSRMHSRREPRPRLCRRLFCILIFVIRLLRTLPSRCAWRLTLISEGAPTKSLALWPPNLAPHAALAISRETSSLQFQALFAFRAALDGPRHEQGRTIAGARLCRPMLKDG
ncbi:hypothetical protein BS50DRAFT_416697 [Corynespora cassiicola Philippines]|uniref:Uncharacterized protein n=1 Tax=Corynespora cassiicola Philippines TaxID=1448308 RepID=A0A2T2NM85_CORCC|nr:hypothetical protein BS50DRAFT_416697 [Corynespora cassiicola Philippines]